MILCILVLTIFYAMLSHRSDYLVFPILAVHVMTVILGTLSFVVTLVGMEIVAVGIISLLQ